MPFWSDKTLRARGEQLIEPYRVDRVKQGAYELSVGGEAYITSEKGKKSKVAPDTPITIPPGQFGLLITQEIVKVPIRAIAFISIRAGTKFRGLVNVSGFHVDPGYNDRLMFSVYNAVSQYIVLDYDQPLFLIWFADLDDDTENPYRPRQGEPRGIGGDDIMRIQGEVASPAELKQQLDDLKMEVDKKFHTTEQTRLFNRGLIMLLLGIAVTIALGLFKQYIDVLKDQKQAPPALKSTEELPARDKKADK